MFVRNTVLSAVVLSSLAGLASAQCSSTKLLAPDRESFDRLGSAAAMGDSDLFVGAYDDDNIRGTDAGSVYVWTGGGRLPWSYSTRLQAPAASENFGKALAWDGTTLLIGAGGGDILGAWPRGAAHFAVRGLFGVWSVGSAVTPNLNPGDDFGSAVDVNGSTAVIGARGRDFNGETDIGSAYVYRKNAQNQWNLLVQIVNPTAGSLADDNLGASVAVNAQGKIAVGVPGYDFNNGTNFNDSGAVMIFAPSGGSYALENGGVLRGVGFAEAGRRFGSAVALDGDYLMVGATTDDGNGLLNCGSVTFYARNAGGTWETRGTFTGSASQAFLGARVAMKGDWAVAAATGSDEVYIFRRTDDGAYFNLQAIVPRADLNATDFVGWAVATNGNDALIGDIQYDAAPDLATGAADLMVLAESSGNDNPGAATTMNIPGTYFGCTTYATPTGNPGSLCGNSNASPDVYYRWVAPFSGTVVLDTVGSSYDTVLSVHSAIPLGGITNLIQCNDDFNGVGPSQVSFTATAGEDYIIRVAGFNGAAGEYTLHARRECPADFNDDGFVDFFDFDDFVACFEGSACPAGKSADFNADGFADFFDFDDFVNAFGLGC
jgi:hypothetical protein